MMDIIDEKMAMVAGDKTPRLTQEEQKKIANAYLKLFTGISAINWAAGADKTLGAAWYQSLGQIKQMIGTRNKNNPSTAYLQQVHATHNLEMSRQMMTNPNKDATLQLSKEKMIEWKARANKDTADAMRTINEMMTKHQAKTTTQTKQAPAPAAQKAPADTAKFAAAQKIMLMKIIMQNKQRERDARA